MSLEPAGKHLVSLVENEELQVLGLEEAALHHVVDSAGGADNDVGASRLEAADVLLYDSASDAGVNFDASILAD